MRKKIVNVALAVILGIETVALAIHSVICKQQIGFLAEKNTKFKKYYNLLNEWMRQKNSGKKFEDYFRKHNINKIAIYGMGEIGQRLYEELKGTDIIIVTGIDQDDNIEVELDIIEPMEMEQISGAVDVVIVAAIADFDFIKETIQAAGLEAMSLEEVVYEL